MFNKMKYQSRGKKAVVMLFFAIAFAVFIAAVVWVLMSLWNAILPEVIGVKPVSYWQAAGILLLSKILFSGFSGGGRKHSWKKRGQNKLKSKWMSMKPEERAEMKDRWKSYCARRENKSE
jgi:hypothetical protein